MRIIPLRNSDHVAIVSNKDFKNISKYGWTLASSRGGRYKYAVRYKGTGGKNLKTIQMHRQILKAKRRQVVDHINHDGLDNRRCNIRLCDYSQNNHNRLPQNGTSKYKGVRYRGYGKYEARIMVNRKHIQLGVFIKEEDAAKAYRKAAKKYHGRFANWAEKEEVKHGKKLNNM